jgi:hypothetical protein
VSYPTNLNDWINQFHFAFWKLALWLIWGIQFGVMEGLGVKDGQNWPTLTYLMRSTLPWWALGMFVGFLFVHFCVQGIK